MTDLRKAAEMALDALDLAQSLLEQSRHHNQILGAYEALRQALAQPEQTKYSDIVSDGGLDPRNKFDAQPEQFVVSFPSFMRRRIEQALKDAIHPTGMSVHDGKVKVLVSDLHRMLLVIDSVLAQPKQDHSFDRTASHMEGEYVDTAQFEQSPPKREWVGLTVDEMSPLLKNCANYYGYKQGSIQTAGFVVFAKAIEAKLKEKNNAV